MRKSFVGCLSVVGVLALAACSSERVVTTDALAGTYVLTLANGDPLPALIRTDGAQRYLVVSETLSFDGMGSVTRTRTDRVENTATGSIETTVVTFVAKYRLTEGMIEIGSFTPCPMNALCIANDTGTVRQGEIFLKSPLFGPLEMTYLKLIELPGGN